MYIKVDRYFWKFEQILKRESNFSIIIICMKQHCFYAIYIFIIYNTYINIYPHISIDFTYTRINTTYRVVNTCMISFFYLLSIPSSGISRYQIWPVYLTTQCLLLCALFLSHSPSFGLVIRFWEKRLKWILLR